ncbi:reverse transcriptase domain-containing protein [Tanacetum coccineum]
MLNGAKKKTKDQIEKFYEIFRDLSFEISFTDALMLMPKFATTLKTLIGNKEKLSELARTPLNENCSAVILNKLPKKLGYPGRFLIHVNLLGITTCNAWPLLADRSITEPIGIAEDVFVNVGKFQFPADFVVVDFEPDPRVPLILGRCFLKTSHALIDVYEGEITLRVGKEAITFNLDQTSKYTADYNHMTVNKIDVIDMACDEYSQEVLGFSNVIAKGDDKLPVIIAKDLKDEEKAALLKIPIDPKDQEKTTFTCPYGTFAYRRMPFGLCNAPGTFQRCMMAIFHDMIEKTMEAKKLGILKLVTVGLLGDTMDFPDCEDSRARSIHKSFTSSASFWESSIQI